MTTTLEQFLAPISKALGNEAVPAAPTPFDVEACIPAHITDGLSQTELVDYFINEADKIRVTVHRCAPEGVAAEVAGIVAAWEDVDPAIHEHEGALPQVIAARDERMASWGIEAALAGVGQLVSWDATVGREAALGAAACSNFGISFPEAAIAETATVIQRSTSDCGRSVSLLPTTHIAILRASTIYASMLDALHALRADDGTGAPAALPSQFCFISGPSATSDIELVRVEGVHGPMYVHYIVVDE